MQVVILAGGLATRLGDVAKQTPKSMIRIEGKPFLEYQVEYLKTQGIQDFLFCIGHLGEQIEDYFKEGKAWDISIQYSREGSELLGTGGAIKRAADKLEDHFFVMYGDSYLQLDYQAIEEAYQKNPESGLMVVFKNENKFDHSNIELSEGRVSHYGQKQNAKLIYIDEGVSVLRKGHFEAWVEAGKFSLGEIFQKLIEQKKLYALETQQRFYEIGSVEGLAEFGRFIKR